MKMSVHYSHLAGDQSLNLKVADIREIDRHAECCHPEADHKLHI